MPRRVLLLINRAKPDAVAAAPRVRGLINAHGRVVGEHGIGDDLPASLRHDADLIAVLGGDGSLLGAARRCIALDLPLLGVNLGKVGFMAEFDLAALEEQAASLFGDAALELQKRPLLRAEVFGPGGAGPGGVPGAPRYGALGLNDCVITAGPPFRLIELRVSIDAGPGPVIAGDGVIVATPIGSTAYSLAAGGSIVSPDVQAFTITPIAAHSLSFRPVIVSAFSTIELEVLRANDDAGSDAGVSGTTLVIDGQLHHRLHKGDRVLVRQHDLPVRFVRNRRVSYWDTLMRKLHWASQPRA
jgi:NAD+ kinase